MNAVILSLVSPVTSSFTGVFNRNFLNFMNLKLLLKKDHTLANTVKTSAKPPLLIHILLPFNIHVLPSAD